MPNKNTMKVAENIDQNINELCANGDISSYLKAEIMEVVDRGLR